MSSKALADFRTSIGYASALVNMERRFADPPTTSSANKVLALRGGAAVLAVAAFEDFLHALFQERMSSLATPGAVDFNKLPEKVQVSAVWNSLELAMRGPLGRSSTKASRIPAVTAAARTVAGREISPEAFGQTHSNPNPTTVKEMFKEAGVPEVFDKARPAFDSRWGKPEANTFLVDKLEEIVQRRHSVAHAVDVRRITRVQLNESVRFLPALAAALDDVLDHHIQGLLLTCAPSTP